MTKFTTTDIGILIRDRIEGDDISHFEFVGDVPVHGGSAEVLLVDVSDANAPVIHLDNGQKFRVLIVPTI